MNFTWKKLVRWTDSVKRILLNRTDGRNFKVCSFLLKILSHFRENANVSSRFDNLIKVSFFNKYLSINKSFGPSLLFFWCRIECRYNWGSCRLGKSELKRLIEKKLFGYVFDNKIRTFESQSDQYLLQNKILKLKKWKNKKWKAEASNF